MRIRRMSGTAGRGYTLVEMAIVLVIAGILLGLASLSWSLLYDGRKISITRGEMRSIRNCIVNRVVSDGLYPNFTPDLSDSSGTVDMCLAGKRDSWGRSIRYIAGFATNGTLAGQCVLAKPGVAASDPCYTGVAPDTASNATGFDGYSAQRVAFILLSYGRSLAPDNDSTIGNLFTAGDLAVTMYGSPNQPNFMLNDLGREDDDVYYIVTYTELASEIAKGRE